MNSVVEYVWVDGSGQTTRSKTRTLDFVPSTPEDVPVWNYDGSSTKQAPNNRSEVELVPVALFPDPFRTDACVPFPSFIALCKTRTAGGARTALDRGDGRHEAEAVFNYEIVGRSKCWFGLEQEYTLVDRRTGRPLGWPADANTFPAPQGPYYCAANAIGRAVAEEHYLACLRAGIKMSGYNAEVMLGQWEFQVGPCEGLDAGDQLWVARYLLDRVCERHCLVATLDPKPVRGDWNGAGLHTNYSTEAMRSPETGWAALQDAVALLGEKHAEHMRVYGEGNERRMTGGHETSAMDRFTHGVGDRGASVRIGDAIARARCGYIEDRRPASNANPYLVTASIARTTLIQ